MKKILLTLLLSSSLLAADKTTLIRVAIPVWAKYKTIDRTGLVEFWATKPFLIYADATPPNKIPYYWWAYSAGNNSEFYYSVESGITNNPNWTKSLRKIR